LAVAVERIDPAHLLLQTLGTGADTIFRFPHPYRINGVALKVRTGVQNAKTTSLQLGRFFSTTTNTGNEKNGIAGVAA